MPEDASPPPPDDAGLPPTRELSWFPLLAAFGIVALIVVLTLVFNNGENRGAPNAPRVDGKGALLCPKAYKFDPTTRYWVPNDPIGVDVSESLVPDEEPERVVVCQFTTLADRVHPDELAGTKRVVLSGNLNAVRTTLGSAKLAAAPQKVADVQRPQPVYLVGLTYSDGTLWVSVGALIDGNGKTVTSEQLDTFVTSAVQTGRWP